MNPSQPGTPANPSQQPPPPGHPGATQPLPPGYAPPPGYPPQMPGYPQGYPMPQGYPPQMPGYPQGYPMPQGYPPQMPGYPQGYPMPQGYPPQMPPGYPPQGYPQGYMPSGMMPTMPMPAVMPPPAPTTGAVAPANPQPQPVSAPMPAMPAPAAVAPSAPIPSGVAPAMPAPSTPMAMASAAPTDEAVAEAVVPHLEGEIFHPPALTHIETGPPPNKFVQMWRKAGGSALLMSILIHAGLGVLALFIVFSTGVMDKQVDFLPGGGTAQGAKASSDLQHKVQQKKRSSINKTMPMKKLVSTSMNSSITLPEAPPDALDMPDVSAMLGGGALGASGGFGTGGAGGGFGKGMGMGGAAGFVTLPPSMRSRCSTQERLEKLRQNGGTPECEAAVSASLEWLKGKQNADGSWGRNNKAAMTGLALLCYLGRCETPESPFYGDNVMKGILFLIETQKANPHKMFSQATKGNAPAYEHGIATYALGEMYTLARLGSKSLPGMREAFEQGVKIIIDNQGKHGSWVYDTDKGSYLKEGREDLSVAGWQFQALKAAKNTSLKIDGLHSAISKMTDYLEAKQTKDGGFGTANRDAHYNQWSLSGVGILGLQTMAKGKTTSIKKGIKFLRDFLTAEPLDWNKNCNLYCWYYYTQAFFQQGGDDWKFYNQQFLPQILAAQQADGMFKRGRPNWPAGDAADDIYRQTLCTLQLEVYYRYLKVADREEDSFFDK